VRGGIALYGLHPSPETRLGADFRPVLRWAACIAQVKSLQPGDPVSYGNTYVADRPRRVAVIPVGYADGFPRAPRHWGSVLIRGQTAPILGRVCMDQTVVDVSEIEAASGEAVRMGEEVTLIGRQGQAHLSAEEVAARLGTINYEVTSRIMARVPRVVRAQA
jgi:alanine racemase